MLIGRIVLNILGGLLGVGLVLGFFWILGLIEQVLLHIWLEVNQGTTLGNTSSLILCSYKNPRLFLITASEI